MTVASPETLGGEPPKRGGRALAKRQRGVAYGLLAPGTLFLFLAFLVPLALIVYTSLQSGGLLSGGFSFTWEFSNYSSTRCPTTAASMWKSLGDLGDRRRSSASWPPTPWRTGSRSTAGRWKSTLFFLILVPFFVSFVIRTVQWKFILGDDGLIFGPLKNLGLLPENFRVLADAVAVICGHHVQLPAVHGAAAVRGAGAHRQAPGRGRQGPVRDAVPGVPQGGAAAVAPGRVRRGDPHVRAGDGRLRERRGARWTGRPDDRQHHPVEVPHRDQLPGGRRAVGDPDDRHAGPGAHLRQVAGHRGRRR